MNIYVPGKGNPNAKIVLLGEAPSYEEEIVLTPFVGSSGRFLNELLKAANINRDACWVTNVCKFMVPPNPKKGRKIPFQVRAKNVGIDLQQQISELRTELHSIKPNVIIAFGGFALWALTGKNGIQNFRGSMLLGMGIKTIPTYRPADILHQDGEVKGYWNKEVMKFDLKRAEKQSHFPELRLPLRTLQICKSSYQLQNFVDRYKNYINPAIDIEAHNCIPICIGIAFTPSEGITVPLWNENGISEMSNSEIINCWRILAEFLAIHSVVGQNFGFDRDKIKRLGFIIKSLHSDTMLKAFAINPELPKNLAFNTSIYTEEPYYKDEGMYEGSVDDLLIGCARDSCVTKEIDLAMDADLDEMNLRAYYENFLLLLHELYFFREDDTAIEQMGFRVDEEKRAELLKKYIEWDETVRYQLYQIAGDYVNTGSWQQVSKLLFEKWKLPKRAGTGEEELTSLINAIKNPVYKRGIELILEDRRIKKTISSYLYSPTDFDKRMKTSYFLCLETGRSATQQTEPPIRPLVHYRDEETGTKKKQARGVAFQTMTKHGDIGADIRTMYIPDEGCIFLQADSSQAEARVIFKLADDEDALDAIDKHDYHALTASWFFGGTEDDYSKKKLGYESPYRFAGKTLRHAGHLGAGKRRAATEVNTQARKYKIDFKISEAKAEEALKTFHALQPKIRKVFHAGIISAIEKTRRLIAPVPYGIEAPLGGTRIFFERYGDELFRQAFSYIPQRTVSENTKAAGLRIRARASYLRIILESHDALLFQCPIEKKYEAAQIIKEEFERPIDFSKCSIQRDKLIIPCDIEEGMNYKDMNKFKWLVSQ